MNSWIKRVILCGLLMMLISGCATVGVSSGVDVSVEGANYTDDYINFTIYSVSGENLGIGGRVKKFSAGGTGGGVCCGVIPKPGGVIKIEWKVGENENFHSQEIVLIGHEPKNADHRGYLIVRFFPKQEIEAEIIPAEDFEPKNPRVDKLYSGMKIMRHKGE